ncbi:hypothetical protein OHB26_39630 (plasmid) [Nocardia sp. NBC_01503]|uniref:hypothetical protein n=1 Tax=Nocardia sp. NBC_01503 TaxID=2975997 RepID=UPI002E7C26F9|nr:hypothetical protein [Nocardia sp. NBC_01503]WTL36657.1 hypothetical protein OHB26_38945 [Nocardia sp. NBC_01503]WTL36790.1 hypothetical protein OHB26_39630 [Nocardia sp. NBC_01503]
MGSEQVVSAKQSVQVAEQYVKDTIETMNIGRSNPEVALFIDRLREGFLGRGAQDSLRSRTFIAQLEAMVGAQQATLFGVTAQTAEAARLWRRHRVVYRVHPGLADSLLSTETTAKVPCEVLARLPHPDPFLVFPEPIPADAGPMVEPELDQLAEPPVFVGMLVTGMTEHEQICSTADPDVRNLQVALASRVHYVGRHPTHEETVVFLPLSGTYSIDELVTRLHGFGSLGQIPRENMQRASNLAISLLLYLCSDHRDAHDHRPEPGKHGKKTRRGEDPTIIDLGFDVGPALHAVGRTSDAESADTGTGAGVRAHLRRAHWHTYWTGPRQSQTPVVRWLHPILVHKDDHQGRPLVVGLPETAERT